MEVTKDIIGKRIRLIEMPDDPNPIKPGEEGVVTGIDGLGQIMMKWDNGSSLSLIPGVDKYEIIDEAAKGKKVKANANEPDYAKLAKINVWGLDADDIRKIEQDGEYDSPGHWKFNRVATNDSKKHEYEAVYDGIYMHVFANLQDLMARKKEIAYYEYDEKASEENGEETFLDSDGNERETGPIEGTETAADGAVIEETIIDLGQMVDQEIYHKYMKLSKDKKDELDGTIRKVRKKMQSIQRGEGEEEDLNRSKAYKELREKLGLDEAANGKKTKGKEEKEKVNPFRKENRNEKVYAAMLEEAKDDKAWAEKVSNDKEWMSNASEYIKEEVKRTLEKSVEELADKNYWYLEYRANMKSGGVGGGFHTDKPAKEKWERLSGETIAADGKKIKKKNIVYVVGELTNEETKSWQIVGVFTKEEDAVKHCTTDMHFVGPLELDIAHPDVNEKWEGAYYPKLEDKKLTDEEIWKLIKKANWSKDNDYKRVAGEFKKLPISQQKQIKDFVEIRMSDLNDKFENDWLGKQGVPGIPVGDDSWSDLRAEVVSRGKEFYDSITADKLRQMAHEDDFHESFHYAVMDLGEQYWKVEYLPNDGDELKIETGFTSEEQANKWIKAENLNDRATDISVYRDYAYDKAAHGKKINPDALKYFEEEVEGVGYSSDDYTMAAWKQMFLFLVDEGFSFEGAKEILKSKHTRWCRDAARDGQLKSKAKSENELSTFNDWKEYYNQVGKAELQKMLKDELNIAAHGLNIGEIEDIKTKFRTEYSKTEKKSNDRGDDKAFHDFKNDMEAALFKKYGILLNDTGIDNEFVRSAMDNNESIDSVVDFIGEKYDLTPISATTAAVEIKSPAEPKKKAENGYICVIKNHQKKEVGRYPVSYNDEKYATDLLTVLGVKIRPGDKMEIVEAESES